MMGSGRIMLGIYRSGSVGLMGGFTEIESVFYGRYVVGMVDRNCIFVRLYFSPRYQAPACRDAKRELRFASGAA